MEEERKENYFYAKVNAHEKKNGLGKYVLIPISFARKHNLELGDQVRVQIERVV